MRFWRRCALCLSFILSSCGGKSSSNPPIAEWVMIAGVAHGDSHLLRLPSGRTFMIDVGAEDGGAWPYLIKNGITKLDAILVTHAHKDHYGGLTRLPDSIAVDRIWFNVPPEPICRREEPWGCDFNHVLQTIADMKKRSIKVDTLTGDEVLLEEGPIRWSVFSALNSSPASFGKIDINDMSIMTRFTAGKTSVLFTGDLNDALGKQLSTDNSMKADILKAPHHGAESTAPNEFYDRVAAQAVLVPALKGLWWSERSSRTRNYFLDRSIPTYVAGESGDVTVRFFPEHFTVSESRWGWFERIKNRLKWWGKGILGSRT